MTDPRFTNEADRDLLVVLPTREEAEEAVRQLVAAGISEDDVQIDQEPDRVASLRAEMHQELSQAWVVPNAGVAYTKEAARGLVAGNVIGIALGVAAAFPLALLPVGNSYWVRFLIFAVVGAAMGGTIGLVAGPGVASTRPNDPPAIEKGTLLRVRHDSPELRALLADLHPIRMDEIRSSDDAPIAAVDLAESGSLHDTAEDLARNIRGDDYQPDPDAPRADTDGKATPSAVDPHTSEPRQ